MKIRAIAGAIMTFTAATLAYLLAVASPGDAVYVMSAVTEYELTAQQKTNLGAAVNATAGSAIAADLDELACSQQHAKGGALDLVCVAFEDLSASSDADYFAAAKAGNTSGGRRTYGPVKVTESGDLEAWSTFTQGIAGVDYDGLWFWRCWRDSVVTSTIKCQHQVIKTASIATFRSDHEAGNVDLVIGQVE